MIGRSPTLMFLTLALACGGSGSSPPDASAGDASSDASADAALDAPSDANEAFDAPPAGKADCELTIDAPTSDFDGSSAAFTGADYTVASQGAPDGGLPSTVIHCAIGGTARIVNLTVSGELAAGQTYPQGPIAPVPQANADYTEAGGKTWNTYAATGGVTVTGVSGSSVAMSVALGMVAFSGGATGSFTLRGTVTATFH